MLITTQSIFKHLPSTKAALLLSNEMPFLCYARWLFKLVCTSTQQIAACIMGNWCTKAHPCFHCHTNNSKSWTNKKESMNFLVPWQYILPCTICQQVRNHRNQFNVGQRLWALIWAKGNSGTSFNAKMITEIHDSAHQSCKLGNMVSILVIAYDKISTHFQVPQHLRGCQKVQVKEMSFKKIKPRDIGLPQSFQLLYQGFLHWVFTVIARWG